MPVLQKTEVNRFVFIRGSCRPIYEAVTGLCTLVSSAIQPNAKLNKPKACVAHINHERTLPAPATTYLVVGKLLLSRRNTGPTMRDTRKFTFKYSHRRVGSQNVLGGKRGGTAGGQVQRYRGFTCFHVGSSNEIRSEM